MNKHINTTYNIDFPDLVDQYSFELIIRQHYRKSNFNKNRLIIFDFGKVNYCALLSLSQLSLWMRDLHNNGKSIQAILPRNDSTYGFLYSYEFINFLGSINAIDTNFKAKTSYTPLKSAMFPLKFHDDAGFKSFLSDLQNDKRRSIIFRDIDSSELVRKNLIHAVILKEIGQNVFDHSGFDAANIIMTKHETLAYNALPFKVSQRLSETPVISLIISDFGVGLPNKLRNAYINDSILPPELKYLEPSEEQLIEYAFLKHSTSRSIEERKAHLQSRLSSRSLEYSIPTGLYKIKNIVEQHQGILLIRSGHTIVGFDYFSKHGTVIKHTNKENTRLKKLSNFPGTQFNLIFPYLSQSSQRTPLTLMPLNTSRAQHSFVGYISLSNYFSDAISENDFERFHIIQGLLDEFETLNLKHTNGHNAVILDVDNFLKVPEKNIKHLIITSAMAAQSKSLAFILVNLDSDSVLELNKDFSDDPYFQELKPLLAYDILFKPYLIGLPLDSFDDLKSRFSNAPTDPTLVSIVTKCNHLCRTQKNSLGLFFDRGDIVPYYSLKLGEVIEKQLLMEENNIYYADQKVAVPNKYYCKGFFDFSSLFDQMYLLLQVCTWVSLALRMEKPQHILSIGQNAKNIVDKVYDVFRSQNIELRATHYHISPQNIQIGSFRIIPFIQRSDKITIFTDVIGSSQILSKILDLIPESNPVSIVTLVDAKPSTAPFTRRVYKNLTCLLRTSIEYHYILPKEWDYSNIRTFDIRNNRLVDNATQPKGPLWKELIQISVTHSGQKISIPSNTFLENISNLPSSWHSGHFKSRGYHILYLFNIREIVKAFSVQISEIIKEYIKTIQEKCIEGLSRDSAKHTAHLLYPDFNPGMD